MEKLSRIILGLLGFAILAGYGHISLELLLCLSIAWIAFGIGGERLIVRIVPGSRALLDRWRAGGGGQAVALPAGPGKGEKNRPARITAARLLLLILIAVILHFLFLWEIVKAWESARDFLEARFRTSGAPEQAVVREGSSVSAKQAASLLSVASSLKPAIQDFYQASHRLPRSSDIDSLPPGARLLENGILEVTAEGDPSATAYWRPLPAETGTRLAWECFTPGIGNLSSHLSECRHDPAFDRQAPIFKDFTANAQVYFQSGRSDADGMTPVGQARLQQLLSDIAPTARNQVMDIQVTGYADPTGKRRGNDQIAEARARFVRESLVRAGIERPLIAVRAVGADPAARSRCLPPDQRSKRESCLAESRRVDIVVRMRRTL